MKVICSPDIHETVINAIRKHPGVSKFHVIDYSDEASQMEHRDATITIAKKEYSATSEMWNLKLFQVATAGYDKINVRALWNRNVAVCNNAGANANAVAELTIASIISCLRNINYQHASVTRNKWDCLKHTGDEFGAQTLGIIGLGKIGTKVAELASPFDCKIRAYDVDERKIQSLKHAGIIASDLPTLLGESDIVTVHIPLSQSTKGHINDTFFFTL